MSEYNKDANLMQKIEAKKGELLAKILTHRNDEVDLPFELFMSFDHLLETTLKNPDEVYTERDLQKDQIYTLIKWFPHENKSGLHYILIAFGEIENDTSKLELIPIIAFPTIDQNLYKQFLATAQNKHTLS